MKKDVRVFISNNSKVFLAILGGILLGYVYWYNYGCYWGSYPLSSEWWLNCICGGLLGGFVSCILEDRIL